MLTFSMAAAESSVRPRPVSWARASAMEYVARAARLEREDRILEALRWLSEAVQMDPSYGVAYLRLGALRERMGDYDEAELVYGRATRRPQTAAEAFAARAQLLRRLNRTDEAVRDLEASIARGPGKAERLEQLAAWYVERRAWPAALGLWRRLLVDATSAVDEERARVQVLALMSLAASTDVVQLEGERDHWERIALRHLAGQASAPAGTPEPAN
jgi:tetratricopeptide (TPR) repeat protein